ncbi:hypothetical protein BGX27_004564 [Mortierella sp. AM989]|nr:hypothetical protein BGX27_004564 [Mortierella sp. AM989]
MMPKSVILRGTSKHGPLELEIPIQILDTPGETIHQLAAKKAIAELEQGRGWITQAKDKDGDYIKSKFESRFEDMVEREAVRLGVQFQIQGRWSSFIAVEGQRGSDMDQASFGNTTFSAPIAYEKEDSSFYPSIKEAGPSPVAQSASPRIQLLEQKRLKLTELRRARESRRASNSVNMELSCGSTNTDGGSRRDIDNLVASLVGSQPCSESQLCAESQPYVVSQASTSMDSLEQGHTSSSTYPFTANSRDYSLSIAGGNDINNSDYTEVIKEEIVSDHAQIFGSMRNTDIGEKIVAPKLGWNGQELENLIELQTFQGFWEWGQRLFDGIRVAVLDAEKIAKDNGWDKRIVATALAIAYMKKKLGNEKETWELVAGKAKEWLKEQIGQDGIVTVLQEAEKLIN